MENKQARLVVKLTTNQKKEAVTLFRQGHKYGEIATQLDVPYTLVNAHMTAWKKDQGIIRTESKNKPEPLTVDEREELLFLRKFYANKIIEQANA